MGITLKQAEQLISLARDAISAYFDGKDVEVPKSLQNAFKEKSGVFVNLYVGKDLVGSIGYPDPLQIIPESVISAARSAAFDDPRYPPLKKEQMEKLRIELSILTEPKVIEVKKPSEYPKKVIIGKDGLMIRDSFGTGILLPQQAITWEWSPKDFLDHACRKAGLSPDCWDNIKQNVYKFQAQIFIEENGKIIDKTL